VDVEAEVYVRGGERALLGGWGGGVERSVVVGKWRGCGFAEEGRGRAAGGFWVVGSRLSWG